MWWTSTLPTAPQSSQMSARSRVRISLCGWSTRIGWESVILAVFCRCSGVSPNRATNGFLPSRSMRASIQVRSPCGVVISVLCLAAIFDVDERVLACEGLEHGGLHDPAQPVQPIDVTEICALAQQILLRAHGCGRRASRCPRRRPAHVVVGERPCLRDHAARRTVDVAPAHAPGDGRTPGVEPARPAGARVGPGAFEPGDDRPGAAGGQGPDARNCWRSVKA